MLQVPLIRVVRGFLLLSIIVMSGCGPSVPAFTPTGTTSSPDATATSTRVAPTVAVGTPTPQTGKATGPLFVNPDNPRYFTDGTKVDGKYRAVYLTGSHTWCNFMDCGDTNPPVAFDYEKYLDFLQAHHLNFFRLWRAENARGGEAGPDFWFVPMPYERSSECCAFDGGNKFDLTKFNQEYFDRLRERVVEAGNRDMYVSIMLFDGWSVESKEGNHNPWDGHPYKLSNNINNINGDLNNDNQGGETHILINNQVTALQEAYVRKVIDTVNDLDNVLYEISNESPGDNPNTSQMDGSKNWQYHMIQYVKEYEAGKPKQHPVGMTWEWLYGDNQVLYDSPADWIGLGGNVAMNTYVPPVANGSKVIVADTDHLCGICGYQGWVWKSFTRGDNPLFMDVYDFATSSRGAYLAPTGNEEEIRASLGYARQYADRMNLTAMTPMPNLCSTQYCLANPAGKGAEYLVFLPAGEAVSYIQNKLGAGSTIAVNLPIKGTVYLNLASILNKLGIDNAMPVNLPGEGTVQVDLSSSPVELAVEWFNPRTGEITSGGTIQGGASHAFTAPFSGDAVLYIHDSTR
jgi:hypothetical protein